MGDMLSTKVSREIAAREGVDPLELDQPLYDAVDVGALETLVEASDGSEGGDLEVEFSYYGYDVVVDGTGAVSVSESPAVANASERSTDQPAKGH